MKSCRVVSVALLTLLGLAAAALAADRPSDKPGRRMVVTIDDLPAQRADRLPLERMAAITRGIVKVLKRERIPAVGFVNEQKLEVDGKVDPRPVALLARWLDAGLELGNHTYSHPDLHHISREEFERNILRGETVTRPLAAAHGKPWRFFRHPYLHTGRDLETRDAVLRFLGEHGYQVAPVTVDNAEWIFAFAYEDAVAKGDRALKRRLAAAYLDYMDAMVTYHEGQSRALFDREIPQILLIHANSLNGDHLADLIKHLRGRGYRFIDLPAALRDPAYASPDIFTGAGGITWFHRWGITRGVDRAMFQGEPRVPKWVQEVAGVEE